MTPLTNQLISFLIKKKLKLFNGYLGDFIRNLYKIYKNFRPGGRMKVIIFMSPNFQQFLDFQEIAKFLTVFLNP